MVGDEIISDDKIKQLYFPDYINTKNLQVAAQFKQRRENDNIDDTEKALYKDEIKKAMDEMYTLTQEQVNKFGIQEGEIIQSIKQQAFASDQVLEAFQLTDTQQNIDQ
jgi:hypothetical protein